MSFHKKETEKNGVSGQTWAYSVLSPQKTIILADGATESILYKSNKVVSEIPSGGQPGKAFYCRDFVCKPPFTDSAELVRLLTAEEEK